MAQSYRHTTSSSRASRLYLPITLSIDQLKACYSDSGRLTTDPLKGLILCLIRNGRITAAQGVRHGITADAFYRYMRAAVAHGLVRRVRRRGQPDVWCAVGRRRLTPRHSAVTTMAVTLHWRDTAVLRTWAYAAIAAHVYHQRQRYRYMCAKARGQASDKHFAQIAAATKPLTTAAVAAIVHLSPRQALRHLRRARDHGFVRCYVRQRAIATLPGYHHAALMATDHNAAVQAHGGRYGTYGFATVRRDRTAPQAYHVVLTYGYRWLPSVPVAVPRDRTLRRRTRPVRDLTKALTSLAPHNIPEVPSFYDEYDDRPAPPAPPLTVISITPQQLMP